MGYSIGSLPCAAVMLFTKSFYTFMIIGPLLYHFTEMCDPSLELSYEEVMEVVKATGFRVEVPIIV